MFSKMLAATTVFALTAMPAAAQHIVSSFHWWRPRQQVRSVPEIDATTGVLAVAALVAALLFVWERNRQRRSA